MPTRPRLGGEGVAGDDPHDVDGVPEAFKFGLDKFGIEVAVLQVKDAERPCRASDHAFDGQPPRCGGGSLRSAQNTPISRIAAKNSSKATGFTTKALTPRL